MRRGAGTRVRATAPDSPRTAPIGSQPARTGLPSAIGRHLFIRRMQSRVRPRTAATCWAPFASPGGSARSGPAAQAGRAKAADGPGMAAAARALPCRERSRAPDPGGSDLRGRGRGSDRRVAGSYSWLSPKSSTMLRPHPRSRPRNPTDRVIPIWLVFLAYEARLPSAIRNLSTTIADPEKTDRAAIRPTIYR